MSENIASNENDKYTDFFMLKIFLISLYFNFIIIPNIRNDLNWYNEQNVIPQTGIFPACIP
jgi:hypothetical protein